MGYNYFVPLYHGSRTNLALLFLLVQSVVLKLKAADLLYGLTRSILISITVPYYSFQKLLTIKNVNNYKGALIPIMDYYLRSQTISVMIHNCTAALQMIQLM